MKYPFRALAVSALIAASALAQGTGTAYFSTRFAEVPQSGRAGDNASAPTVPCGGINTPGPLGNYKVESAIANSEGLSYVQPGVLNMTIPFTGSPGAGVQTTDFVEVMNFPQWELIIGDLDADGIPTESSNFPGIDAIYIPTPPGGHPNRPLNIHEMFVSSFSDSSGSQGFLGAGITEADMVMLPRAANPYPVPPTQVAPIFFVRQAHWETFFGLPAPNNAIDVDSFAVDEATGDIYVSFDGAGGTNNVAFAGAVFRTSPGGPLQPAQNVLRGDIFRIPAAAYTPSGPYGIVTNPVSGLAERVLASADVLGMVTFAGGTLATCVPGCNSTFTCATAATSPLCGNWTPVNVYSLDLEPLGGSMVTPSGFTIANLLFTVDNRGGCVGNGPTTCTGTSMTSAFTATGHNMSATAIYSTLGGGMFAVINGVLMDRPSSAGIRDTGFTFTFYAGPLDALDVVSQTFNPFLERPVHLDFFPTRNLLSTNANVWGGTVEGHVSGAQPFASLAIMGSFILVPIGGYAPRWDVSGFLPGYPDLYVDPFGIADPYCLISPAIFSPYCQSFLQPLMSTNPAPVWVDPVNNEQNGDTCFRLDLSSVVPPFPNQGPAYTTPGFIPLLIFQAVDLSNLRLSSPMSYQFN